MKLLTGIKRKTDAFFFGIDDEDEAVHISDYVWFYGTITAISFCGIMPVLLTLI